MIIILLILVFITDLSVIKTTRQTDQDIRYIVFFHQGEHILLSVSFFSFMGRNKTWFFSVAQSLPLCSVCIKQNAKNLEEATKHIKPFLYSYYKEQACQTSFIFFFPWNLSFKVGTS